MSTDLGEKASKVTLSEFWDIANTVLVLRDQPEMLLGEAQCAYDIYKEDVAALLNKELAL